MNTNRSMRWPGAVLAASLLAVASLAQAAGPKPKNVDPARMAYERVIPIVDITAKLLSNALSHN